MTPEQKSGLIKGIIFLVVIALVITGYFIISSFFKTPDEKAADAVKKSLENAGNVALPQFGAETAPLQDLPVINPIEKTNPFKNVYQNPFK